jgi:hypothetical protein
MSDSTDRETLFMQRTSNMVEADYVRQAGRRLVGLLDVEIVKLREALEEIAGYESASLSPNPLLSQVRAIAADALSDD